MVTSVTFGQTAPQTYAFTNVQAFSDNFGDLVAQSLRLPALDGGFDIYGSTRAPKSIGQVRVSATLFAATRAEMSAALDSVRAMIEWGVQKLIIQPTNPAYGTRYCYARVNNISIAQRPADQTDLIQPVQIVFQVSDPFWRASTASSAIINAAGTSTTQTVNNAGNAADLPIITIMPPATKSAQNIEIRRVDGSGNILDAIGYTGTLSASDTLVINCKTSAMTVNGSDAWSSKNEANTTHPDWLRLLAGNNSIRVIMANAGDETTVTLAYEATYH